MSREKFRVGDKVMVKFNELDYERVGVITSHGTFNFQNAYGVRGIDQDWSIIAYEDDLVIYKPARQSILSRIRRRLIG